MEMGIRNMERHKEHYVSKKLNDFHGAALVASSNGDIVNFNRAIREFHSNSDNFQFKAFHYYLTRALQLLNQGDCYTVYKCSVLRFHYNETGNVSLGGFIDSTLSKRKGINPFILQKWQWKMFKITTAWVFLLKDILTVHMKACCVSSFQGMKYIRKSMSPKRKNILKLHLRIPQNDRSNYNCFYHSLKNNRSMDTNYSYNWNSPCHFYEVSSGESGSVLEMGVVGPLEGEKLPRADNREAFNQLRSIWSLSRALMFQNRNQTSGLETHGNF